MDIAEKDSDDSSDESSDDEEEGTRKKKYRLDIASLQSPTVLRIVRTLKNSWNFVGILKNK